MKQVTAAILRKEDKILIAQRAADDECPLLWEFPGGKLEEGETLEECIVREMKEELAIDIALEGVFAVTKYHLNGAEIPITFFNARIAGGDIQKNVHNDVRWIRTDMILQYDFMPPDWEVAAILSGENNQIGRG